MTTMLGRIAFCCVLVVAGCSAAPATQRQPPPNMPPPSNMPPPPVDGTPPPAPLISYAGLYAVATPLDLTQDGVLPGMVGPALAALIELHDHPGDAIIALVVAAQIPSVSDAVAGLPTFVKDLLAALLDKLIVDELYDEVPIVEQITGLVSGLTELTRTIELDNHLTVHAPDGSGAAAVDLQTIAVKFTLLGSQTVIPFDLTELEMAHASLNAQITPRATAPAADANLSLAGGNMSLPFGRLALQAAGPLLFSRLGATDLDGALRNLVPCHEAAQSISDGIDNLLSAATIEKVCTGALDIIAATVTTEIERLVLQNVQIGDASGYLLDTSVMRPIVDHQSDRIAQGKWTWSFSVAGHTLRVPSTLEGDRIADVP